MVYAAAALHSSFMPEFPVWAGDLAALRTAVEDQTNKTGQFYSQDSWTHGCNPHSDSDSESTLESDDEEPGSSSNVPGAFGRPAPIDPVARQAMRARDDAARGGLRA